MFSNEISNPGKQGVFFVYLQQPVASQNQGDVFSGQAHSVKYHDHRDQSSLRDASSANTRRCCSNAEKY